jgi:hypothetical protein
MGGSGAGDPGPADSLAPLGPAYVPFKISAMSFSAIDPSRITFQ